MPITFAVKIVELKADLVCAHSDHLDLHSRSQLRVKLDKCFTCTVIVIYLGEYLSYGGQTYFL